MNKLASQLIKLGHTHPELRDDIRPILDTLTSGQDKTAKSYSMSMDLLGGEAAMRPILKRTRAEDRQVYKMLGEIQGYFSEKFTKNDEMAYNRLRNMLNRAESMDMEDMRNQVAKVANLLGLDTPLMF